LLRSYRKIQKIQKNKTILKNAEKVIKFIKLKKNAEKFRIECFFDFIASQQKVTKDTEKFNQCALINANNSEKCRKL
jgi:hypothetical protein